MKSIYSWLHGKKAISSYRPFCKHWWSDLFTLRNLRVKFEDSLERARFGVARRDVWSFDSYLCHVMINGLSELRRRNSGAPMLSDWLGNGPEGEWDVHEDNFVLWAAILTAMIDGFEAHLIEEDAPWLSGAPAPEFKTDVNGRWRMEDEPFCAWLHEHEDEHDLIRAELAEREALGMQLFTEYFGALWD